MAEGTFWCCRDGQGCDGQGCDWRRSRGTRGLALRSRRSADRNRRGPRGGLEEGVDELLARRAGPGSVRALDSVADYEQFVDGKPRLDGVRSFLESRDIHLAEGGTGDGPDRETVNGVGRRKNELVLTMMAEVGVTAFPGSVALVRALRAAGRRVAVVSASEIPGCARSGRDHRPLRCPGRRGGHLRARIGGQARPRHVLRGPPTGHRAQPRCGGGGPPAGVAAGRAGRFGLVIGVSRGATAAELLRSGADVVVSDLAELLDTGSP